MTSKFRGLLDQAKGRGPEPEPQPPSPTPADVPAPPRRGRPPGKRSDPGFVQVTAYVPDDLHHNVKMALLQERQGREFSELVAELLADWLKSRS